MKITRLKPLSWSALWIAKYLLTLKEGTMSLLDDNDLFIAQRNNKEDFNLHPHCCKSL